MTSLTFRSVLEAVRAAGQDFAETVLVLPSALAAAADSPYRRPNNVYDAIKAMHDVCLLRRAALEKRRSMGAMYDAFLQKGLRYSPHESPQTLARWGDERTVVYRGKKVLAQAHLALGKGGPEACLRIHFFSDPEPELKFVVAHVGRHLTNTRT
jgi:hypothetical protein